jgi:2-dehydropantoate 2-reductase
MTDVAVVGPGAIGATFAAAAERAGHAVALCGRRPGPTPVVELPDGQEHALAGHVQCDPSAAEPVPWILLAVKTHQTAGATRWLERLCGAGTVIAVLQNGVEHEALVAPLAGPATLLPAIVWCPAETVTPGRVRQRERARLSVPETPAGAVLAALLGDHARVDLVADFRTEAWRKLCLNATAAPMVLTGRRAEVFREPARWRSRAGSPRSASPSGAPRARASAARPSRRSSAGSRRSRPTRGHRCCSTASPAGGWSGTRATA